VGLGLNFRKSPDGPQSYGPVYSAVMGINGGSVHKLGPLKDTAVFEGTSATSGGGAFGSGYPSSVGTAVPLGELTCLRGEGSR